MDSTIIYTTEPALLWQAIVETSRRHNVVIHGTPPEISLELADARMYVSETRTEEEQLPVLATGLGSGVRQLVVDMHNRSRVEAFLADALVGLRVVVDDDNGNVRTSDQFVTEVNPRGDTR